MPCLLYSGKYQVCELSTSLDDSGELLLINSEILSEFNNEDIFLLSKYNNKYQKYAEEYLMNLKGGGKKFVILFNKLREKLNNINIDIFNIFFIYFSITFLK